ncbi:MAG: tRNA(adenine34) deaminase [Planctomycetota bacterium]
MLSFDNQAMNEMTSEQAASFAELDRGGMALALAYAEEARDADEVPIGAIVVRGGAILGVGRNRCREAGDCTAHAEMVALKDAFQRTGDMRLPGATVYTTVEPCFMCAGALSHARIARVVWSVRDPKFGGAASLGTVLTDTRLNHRAEVLEGVFDEEARHLMQSFFRSKRQ